MVYASLRFAQRQEVWDDLARLAETTSEAWVILGDFNSIPVEHERRGGEGPQIFPSEGCRVSGE